MPLHVHSLITIIIIIIIISSSSSSGLIVEGEGLARLLTFNRRCYLNP